MFEHVMDTSEYDSNFEDFSRISDDISFFSSQSPPSSPLPCPISPCRSDNSNLLSMEDNTLVDLNSLFNNQHKPFSPACKRLNMDIIPHKECNLSSLKVSAKRKYLHIINENIPPLTESTVTDACKRSKFSEVLQNSYQNRANNVFFSPHLQTSQRKTTLMINPSSSSNKLSHKSSEILHNSRF
ncbi:CLUMA_CG020180, isoform A [Clunio marinus]|uniref:CLUMA_CG020180, isoform A n=1 Tax=Clunio marinus TaxID=568069 RepID=A0A1J1J456_9DIPT|nr:CLUMA_CG020180, isoform A [Clunio marinus]